MKAKQEQLNTNFKMDLQLFSDSQPSQGDLHAQAMQILQGGNAQPEGAAPTQGQQQPTEPSNPQNSPQSMENGGQPSGQPGQEPDQGQLAGQAPQGTDALILGKFKSPDELANGYSNLEKGYTQTRQELASKDQQLQAMQQAMEQMKQQMSSIVNPQQQEIQPTPEELSEQTMQKLYDNPYQFFNDMKAQAKQEILQEMAPIRQQYQAQQQQNAFNQAMQQFTQQTPDAANFQGAISEVLAQNPELNYHPNGPMAAINIAYNMAKGQQYQDPNALLQNQDFVKNNILSNQDIKNQVIQEYLQSLQKGNQAPTVISGQANGSTPIMPMNKPTNKEEARAAALKLMQG